MIPRNEPTAFYKSRLEDNRMFNSEYRRKEDGLY